MKKKLLSLSLSIALVLASALSVYADETEQEATLTTSDAVFMKVTAGQGTGDREDIDDGEEIVDDEEEEIVDDFDEKAPPSFVVKGIFGGRLVTFNCDNPYATIYYSTTTSKLTLNDYYVYPGETLLASDFYGTVYARAYYNGQWSNVSRLVLKIPKVNTPTITKLSNGKYKIKTTTPGTIVYYTIDGSTPSADNYAGKFWTSHDVYIPAGRTVKAVAVRTCFTDSNVATART